MTRCSAASATTTPTVTTALMLALWAAVAVSAPAAAQRVPALGGAEARVGIAFPEQAVLGPSLMAELDLGYVWRPELRLIAGLSHFSANIDREPGDDEGSYRATGLWLGGRLDFLPRSLTAPYVRASVTVQSVSADAWDPDVGELLDGINAGAALAVGARRTLDARGSLAATIEVRRTALNNIAHTAVDLGIRWQRRGAWMYLRDPVAVAPAPVRDARDRWAAADPARPVGPARDPADVDPAEARRLDEARQRDAAGRAAERAADDRAAEERMQDERAARTDVQRAAEARAAEAAAARSAATAALLSQALHRATAAMSSASAVRETGEAYAVAIGGGAFATGASTLSAAARAELRLLATVLAGYPGHIVGVEGHTDAVGDPAANRALSIERAAAVRAALIAEGVDPLWIEAHGHGQARPAASNETAAGRAANRRVEILIARLPCAAPPRPGPDGRLVCSR